jgi:Cys-tRNA(Pro)/Cys-tRNA(Cys) deacylase
VIPVDKELDMKAAARAAGEKNIELIPVKEITPVTGYVRGGCTAIGMKKNYPVIIQKSAADFDTIAVSGGHLGVQITLSPTDFIKVTRASYADIIE